jgi:hypothetical protein
MAEYLRLHLQLREMSRVPAAPPTVLVICVVKTHAVSAEWFS